MSQGDGQSEEPIRVPGSETTSVLGVRRTLAQYGQQDAVALIDRTLQGSQELASLVVVGEVKRGKSTLVNALCGAPLSPSSADIPSTAVLMVVPGSEELPLGQAELIRPSRTELVTVEQAVAELMPDESRTDVPLAARLAHEPRWLPGTVLIDTPGVGGLGSIQGKRAAMAAEAASALLFVTDGTQPLTAPELTFLSRVSENVEHVVLVLARVDRNPAAWEEIRDENRQLLTAHAPRFASQEIHPVSAAYAMHALTQPAQLAERLEQASRVPELAAELRDLLSDRRRLAVAKALRIGQAGLDRLAAGVELEIRAADHAAVRADLQAEQARLLELQQQLRRSKLELERDLGRIRQAAIRHTNQAADDLVARMSDRIAKTKRGMSAQARTEFESDLAAELALLSADVQAFTRERLTKLVQDAFGALDSVPEVSRLAEDLQQVDTRVRVRPSYATNPLLDPSLAGTAFMGSRITGGGAAYVATHFTHLSLGGPVALLAGLVGAGALLGLNVAMRGSRQGQQELAGTLAETISGARGDLVAGIDAWIRELRPELHIALEDHLRNSINAVRAMLEDAQKTAAASDAERRRNLEQLRLRREAIVTRRKAVAQQLQQLATAPLAEIDNLIGEQSALPGAPTDRPDQPPELRST